VLNSLSDECGFAPWVAKELADGAKQCRRRKLRANAEFHFLSGLSCVHRSAMAVEHL